jgi:hypothetical protein
MGVNVDHSLFHGYTGLLLELNVAGSEAGQFSFESFDLRSDPLVFGFESGWVLDYLFVVVDLLLDRLDLKGEFNVINFVLVNRVSQLSKLVLLRRRDILSYLGVS